MLFVLSPPIPNYNVDDCVLRGAGRRRVSDYFAAVCTQHFHIQLCERGKGGGLQHIWRPEHVRLFRRHRSSKKRKQIESVVESILKNVQMESVVESNFILKASLSHLEIYIVSSWLKSSQVFGHGVHAYVCGLWEGGRTFVWAGDVVRHRRNLSISPKLSMVRRV